MQLQATSLPGTSHRAAAHPAATRRRATRILPSSAAGTCPRAWKPVPRSRRRAGSATRRSPGSSADRVRTATPATATAPTTSRTAIAARVPAARGETAARRARAARVPKATADRAPRAIAARVPKAIADRSRMAIAVRAAAAIARAADRVAAPKGCPRTTSRRETRRPGRRAPPLTQVNARFPLTRKLGVNRRPETRPWQRFPSQTGSMPPAS